jgi:RNA-directed DNA polymerase
MSKAMRQMPERSGRASVARGEAVRDLASDEASGPPREHQGTGSARPKAGTGSLLEAALTRENLRVAWKRVKANKGAAGVDGLDIEQTALMLQTKWPQIRQALLAGRYRPEPVRRVMIPKPDGSQRELGIPTVVDRLIQQALLQVLQPLIDPTFSEHSHGFRPGRRAHDAVKAARAYVQSGKRVVVDVDLAKFFDRVNHDILMSRLRAIQLWHWRRSARIHAELKALGAAPAVAKRVAGNAGSWWRNSDRLLKTVLTIAYFDRMGLPRLS